MLQQSPLACTTMMSRPESSMLGVRSVEPSHARTNLGPTRSRGFPVEFSPERKREPAVFPAFHLRRLKSRCPALWSCGLLAILCALCPATALANESRAAGIMDNSFFVEEAYNQEPGVVQHITTAAYEVSRLSGPDARAWHLSFTQEWPLYGQAHQFSYTLPYVFLREPGPRTDGLGDVMLHYRYQIWLDPDHYTALAPRASVILPTGDADRGLGEDTVGAQFNLPFSTLLGPNAFLHANAGLTALPDAASAGGRDLIHYHVAASAIYAAHRNLHLLLEWVGAWEHGLDAAGGRRHEWVSWISPGFRYALNLPRDLQIVAGIAAPIGLTESAPDYGVFLYLSIEHFMWRPR